MKKLNNHGMTIIEILVCFILVMGIAAALYATIDMYNQKKHEESIKQSIYTYKNLLTRDIYQDIIRYRLKSATIGTNSVTLNFEYEDSKTLTFGSNFVRYGSDKFTLPAVKEKHPLTFDLSNKKLQVSDNVLSIDVRIVSDTLGKKYGVKVNTPTNVDQFFE
ncbi:MAG: hypothetical protein IJI43_00280 [Bacilli bacterium]|nr:hypothetical protein [Bacilli bacterium]